MSRYVGALYSGVFDKVCYGSAALDVVVPWQSF